MQGDFPRRRSRRLPSSLTSSRVTKAADRTGARRVVGGRPDPQFAGQGFIALGARAETVGNPYTYVTTQEFMKYFGINRIPEDLPRLREFSELLEAGALVPQYAKQESEPEVMATARRES
jgi:Predicted transcriptional regulator containing the HTH domain